MICLWNLYNKKKFKAKDHPCESSKEFINYSRARFCLESFFTSYQFRTQADEQLEFRRKIDIEYSGRTQDSTNVK